MIEARVREDAIAKTLSKISNPLYKIRKLGQAATPPEVVDFILDSVDEQIFKDGGHFVDLCCGRGTFLLKVIDRLLAHHSKEDIANMIFGFDIDSICVNNTVNVITQRLGVSKNEIQKNIVKADSLQMTHKFKNPVILMNPPYLKRKWAKFVNKAVELNPKLVITINPDPTANNSVFGQNFKQTCIDNGIIARMNVTDYFKSVDSGTIGAFIMDPSKQADLDVFTSDDPILDSIVNKVLIETPNSFIIRGHQNVAGYGESGLESKDTKQDDFTIPSIMSATNDGLVIKYCNTKVEFKKYIDQVSGRFAIFNRFFGKNKKDPVFEIDDLSKYNMSQNCMAYKLEKDETLESFVSVYGSTLYRYVIKYLRNGGFDINQSSMMQLPKIDLTRIWTDDEIFKHFEITQEERDYINEDD
jgi:predicted RNA methylase